MFRHLLVLLSISLASFGQNISKKIVENKSDHYLVHTYWWQALSGLGVVGTILNSFLLHTFFIERKGMATSVNAMICCDTLHRMIYSAICIHWRTCNMIDTIIIKKKCTPNIEEEKKYIQMTYSC